MMFITLELFFLIVWTINLLESNAESGKMTISVDNFAKFNLADVNCDKGVLHCYPSGLNPNAKFGNKNAKVGRRFQLAEHKELSELCKNLPDGPYHGLWVKYDMAVKKVRIQTSIGFASSCIVEEESFSFKLCGKDGSLMKKCTDEIGKLGKEFDQQAENGIAAFLDDYVDIWMLRADILALANQSELTVVQDCPVSTPQATMTTTKATLPFTTMQTIEPMTKAITTAVSTTIKPVDINNFKIRFKNKYLNYRLVSGQQCSPETNIFMLSMARRYGFKNRKMLRETWIKDMRPNETIRFFIIDAPDGGNESLEKQLNEEKVTHGDLVFFQGLNDTYYNLHLKMYAAMQWQQAYCAKTEWVLKVDDDINVHLRRLEYWIEHKFRPFLKKQNPLTIFGYRIHAKPIRDKNSKWYVSKSLYPEDEYPHYMAGPAFLTTSDTIAKILLHAPLVKEFYLEDVVYTGIETIFQSKYVSESDYPKEWYPNFTSGTTYLTTSDTIAKLLWYAPKVKEFHLEDVLYTGMVAELANVTRSKQNRHFLWKDEKVKIQKIFV